MADEKEDFTQAEVANEPQPALRPAPKKRTCARHCKRFWWIYLIAFLLIALLVILLIIFVAVPKIAQKKINEAELDIQGVNVLQTKSDAYLMQINSTVKAPGGIKATVDSFEGEMYLEDYPTHAPFATIEFPKTNNNKHQIVNISQEMKITDLEEFTRFNVWFHNNETLRVTIKGKTKVKPSGLARKSSVNFEKTVTFKGLNVFKGTEVTDGHISIEADDDGKNFNGTANIPNASVYTLDIGNVTFDNAVGDASMGKLYIDNLILRPGDNNVNITATMDQIAILQIMAKKPYCETGIVPFKLLGEEVENHGQNISYFASALGSKNQTVNIDIGAIIEKDLKTKVKCK